MAAIDQLIAQGGGQQFDPLATVGRVTQLQNLRLQGQAAQTQNQTAQLENQQRQQQLNDQQAMTRAMQSWDGQDYNALPGLVMKSGGSATAVMGLKKSLIEQQQSLANLSKDQLANEKVKNDYFAQLIANVKQVPPEQQPQAFEAAKAQAAQRGLLSPQEAQQYQYQGPDQLDIIEKGLIGHSNALAMAEKQSTIAKNNAEAREKGTVVPADAVAAKVLNVPVGSPQPLAVVQKARETAAVGMENATYDGNVNVVSKIDPNVPARKLGAAPAVTTFNLQNAVPKGENGQPSQLAQMVANRQMKWTDAVSARWPLATKAAFAAEVKSIDPTYNTGDFDVEKKVREKYTSGNVSDQLLAIGTAREHMKLFSQLASALDNGNVQAANKIGNTLGVQFGSDKATNFRIASQAFGGEVGKAFDGAGVTEGERKSASSSYNENMGNQQFQGAVKTVDALLAGKQKAAKDAYSAGTHGKPNFGNTGTEGGAAHVIKIGNKQYQYKGTGATDDLSNYTELK